MAQPAHPQPQEDFPFLLSLTMPMITAAATIIRIVLTMIVAIFSIIHANIKILLSSHGYRAIFTFTFRGGFVASLYGLNSI